MTRNLADLRAPQIAEHVGPNSILVLPLGATEQHGPHLPLSTDTRIAEAFTNGLAERAGDELDLWMLPVLNVTKSSEHAWSTGTLWLSAETLHTVLDEIAANVAGTGCRRLVLLNAHGGNTTLLGTALREIRRRHGLLTFLVHPFVPPAYGGTSNAAELGMGIHGGHDETSLMLHLAPDLVDLDAATRQVPADFDGNEFVKFGGPTAFGWLSNDFGPDGHIGDPTTATATDGAQLFDEGLDHLIAQFREIATFDFRHAS